MDHLFTEEQRSIQELARRIAEEKVKPVRARYDEGNGFPWDIFDELAKTDLFRVFVPVMHGGLVESGYGVVNLCIVTEELSKACAGIALAYAGTALGAFPILLFGSEEQKARHPACYSEIGRPSIDPVVVFKLQLIAFFEGNRSERQLMETVNLNLAHRWYIGYDLGEMVPDHSSLSKIRERYGLEVFHRFFEHIIEMCIQAGLVWGAELYFDSTSPGKRGHQCYGQSS